MTDEQLIDDVSDEPVEAQEQTGAETAKAEEKEPDYQKIIAEKAYEARQARREKEELARRLQELESRVPQQERPTVPPVPDPWDDNFEEKLRQRDEALRKVAAYEVQQNFIQQQRQQAEQQAAMQKQQALAKKVETYSQRAQQLGIAPDELAQAGQRLTGAISDQLVEHILADDKGPLLTKYLAANPLVVDSLSAMSPMQAAVFLETQVKPKAAQFSAKRVSNAPEPVDVLSGNGAAPFEGPEGGQFY